MKDAFRIATAVFALSGLTLTQSAFGRVQVQPSAGGAGVDGSASALWATFGGIRAVTMPSRDSTMSFTFPTEIAEIAKIGGTSVKKGDVLVRGRDEEYRFQRDLQKLSAESDLAIQKAKAVVEQAKVEFTAQEELKAKKVYSQTEYDRARVLLLTRQVELELAKLEYEQQKVQLMVREAQLDRLVLKAPFDGKVDMVMGDVGVVKKETEPVVRVVGTDPLWMDVFAPINQTLELGLKPGDKAWVLMDLPGEAKVYQGKVIEVGADAAFEANKRRVRVELPNPSDWPSGPAAWVRFTAPEGEWAKRVVEQAQKRAAAEPGGGAPETAGR
jgi:multidrug efflux pump subunit AcrA (membrane-fusion protein)